MKERERLLALCVNGLRDKGLNADQRYKDRLKKEIKAVDEQGEHEYLLKLHAKFQAEKLIFPKNENNNLIDYILGLAPDFNIDEPSAYVQGEAPDIDIDYLKVVRDYLKRDWAPKRFGQDKVCEIGTYGTLGIKSAILDMARLHSLPRDEIQQITNKIKDKFSDDEGNTQDLEWEDALEIYPEFKEYCERDKEHRKAAEDAYLALDRNKSGGVHAGGLIIADRPLDGFIPLEVRSVKKENPNGVICSAWTEGLNRQDLQPVGLIKFDLLVINNLMQIAQACKLVKERHGLDKICALPGQWDWSDISYLNDPKALAMADRGDLKCIFQFDSEGIRKLVKRGGVTRFDDLAIYSALYRPGPLNMGMDARYCKRKRGEEPFNIHPIMQKALGKTYGVLAFQEQIMDILRLVGLIPDMHTEKVRKAISKKKKDQFLKYKEQFIDNGQRTLNVNAEYVINLWEQIEAFAAYGFNASHAYAYAYISARLLWLKAHYPLEFYTAILMSESDDEKFKEYKLDAKYHGVEVNPVHINKSRVNFNIADEKVYFGFSNIKKVGEGVSEKIVEHQPYTDFTDFLDRFGTDATVLKALTALGVFEEPHDRLTLRKFSEFYKKQVASRRDRKKRFEESMDKKLAELKALLLEEMKEDDPDFEKMSDFTEDSNALWESRFAGITRKVPYKYKGEERVREVTFVKLLQDLAKKRQSSIDNFHEKERLDDDVPVTLDQFNPSVIKLDPEEEKILTDEMVVDGHKTYPLAESIYYGFQWTHVLETSPDYTGATLDKFLEAADQGVAVGMVEVQIVAVRKRTSKKGTEFYSVDIEDANAKRMVVNVWHDDYIRFKDELKAGHMVKMRVRPPSGGFNTLTFESVPRHERKKLGSKEEDYRLLVMKSAPPVKKEEDVLDEFKFDQDAFVIPTAAPKPVQSEEDLLAEMEVNLGEAGLLEDYYAGEAEQGGE